MSPFTSSWRRARDLAQQRRADGRLEESLCYLVHAIRSAPRRADLVREYVTVATAHSEEARSAGRIDEAVRRLELVEAFVREAAVQVKLGDVAGLLVVAEKIASQRAELAPAAEEEIAEPDHQEPTARGDDAKSSERELSSVPDAISEAFQAARRLLAAASSQPSGVAGSILSAVDVMLRSAVALAVSDRPAAIPELEALLTEVRTRADALATSLRSREADEAWNTFMKQQTPSLEAAKVWPPPEQDGACEAQLGQLRELLLALAQIGPVVAGTPRECELQKLSLELRGIGERLGKEQSARYNRWAMDQMKRGFEHAADETGFFGDAEKVGQRLIDHYGSIDIRHLRHEVARCHSETFEHLFAKLKSPPDSDSAATKLYVLRALFSAKKRELTDY